METELTLKEKYLLLCYHPEKGRMLSTSSFASYGIAGAIMLELAELDKFKLTNDKVFLADTRTTGDKVLDLVVERIAKSKRNKKISQWISGLANSGLMRTIKSMLRESLMKRKILSLKEKTALGIFKYNRYPARNAKIRRQIILDIHDVVIGRKIGSKDTMILTALIGATKMTTSFFIREERARARKRVKEIMKNNEIAKVLDSTVTAVQAAIVTTITTTAVVSAATTSSS
jgi:hypothetical protein